MAFHVCGCSTSSAETLTSKTSPLQLVAAVRTSLQVASQARRTAGCFFAGVAALGAPPTGTCSDLMRVGEVHMCCLMLLVGRGEGGGRQSDAAARQQGAVRAPAGCTEARRDDIVPLMRRARPLCARLSHLPNRASLQTRFTRAPPARARVWGPTHVRVSAAAGRRPHHRAQGSVGCGLGHAGPRRVTLVELSGAVKPLPLSPCPSAPSCSPITHCSFRSSHGGPPGRLRAVPSGPRPAARALQGPAARAAAPSRRRHRPAGGGGGL